MAYSMTNIGLAVSSLTGIFMGVAGLSQPYGPQLPLSIGLVTVGVVNGIMAVAAFRGRAPF
jgi:hypothetical protein